MDTDTPKKSSLYTRTGDGGKTSLVGGQRVAKNSPRLEAYGTVDELNSWLGMLWTVESTGDTIKRELQALMCMMFDLGSYLATADCPDSRTYGITDDRIGQLEKAIDRLDARVEPMRCFVLPCGTRGSAIAHVARTVCRRAERRILTLAQEAPIDPRTITLLNRLSDYLFALARFLNAQSGVSDTPWDKNATL